MPEIIKAVIDTQATTPGQGYDLIVRCIENPPHAPTKSTLVKKAFIIKEGKKEYRKHHGLNISDLLIVKRNWNKILGAMAK